jgi:hypothetical protein
MVMTSLTTRKVVSIGGKAVVVKYNNFIIKDREDVRWAEGKKRPRTKKHWWA